jgi:hypothetical protein
VPCSCFPAVALGSNNKRLIIALVSCSVLFTVVWRDREVTGGGPLLLGLGDTSEALLQEVCERAQMLLKVLHLLRTCRGT